ncbi:MAG: hypothetical protein JST58_01650 [Bacteroidetes bacterium]|jgi:hypothetical protein|nr:hypothetical protein [Bacteroidota bacterium]
MRIVIVVFLQNKIDHIIQLELTSFVFLLKTGQPKEKLDLAWQTKYRHYFNFTEPSEKFTFAATQK